jgi:hypothetical protein
MDKRDACRGLSGQVGRLNLAIVAHLTKQTFADLLREILDGRAAGSEIHDPVAAPTPARIHVERYSALSGKPA